MSKEIEEKGKKRERTCLEILQPWLLAFGILFFGTWNTLNAKFQNRQSFQCLNGTYICEQCPKEDPPPDCIDFEQPFFQAFFSFVAEASCLIPLLILVILRNRTEKLTGVKQPRSKLKGWNYLIFAIPAGLDVIGTSMMNLGLVYTNASVYQMLRGVVVVFTGAMAALLLKRKQYAFQWVGIVLVVLGVAVVGLVSIILNDNAVEPAKNPLLGDVLVVAAQFFLALQMISEEKFLDKYDPHPLEVVGYEGIAGIIILSSLLAIFQVTLGDSGETGNIFDVRFGMAAFAESLAIMIPCLSFIVSYAFTNFCGVFVTKLLGATARTTIEQCRTLIVWCAGLAIGWETFFWPQIIGFITLVLGTFVYNKVFQLPWFTYPEVIEFVEGRKSLRSVGKELNEEEKALLHSVNEGSKTSFSD